jgi:crotonobetainyl-CoA:carnitine CoA-transferase CaiB-like acyl-CoA transferase
MPSFGLDYPTIHEANPGVVMTSISNFGQTGPYRDYKMTELTLYALGGTMHSTGVPDREPLKLALTVEQFFAGMVSATAAMGAYMGAQLHGTGQRVDLSLFEIIAGNQDRAVQAHTVFQYAGTIAGRAGGSGGRNILPNGVYPVSDGYVQFFALQPIWDRFCRMIDRPDLIEDAHFTAPENFTGNAAVKAEVDAMVYEWLLVRTKREVMEKAQSVGYFCGAINSMEDVFNDPHLAAREFFAEVEHPVAGSLRYPGAPFKMTESPWRAGRAPLLGEHTAEVLCERLGHSAEDLTRLREQGVV